jgi:hypothetical protein
MAAHSANIMNCLCAESQVIPRPALAAGACDQKEEVAKAARKALYAAVVKAAANDPLTGQQESFRVRHQAALPWDVVRHLVGGLSTAPVISALDSTGRRGHMRAVATICRMAHSLQFFYFLFFI